MKEQYRPRIKKGSNLDLLLSHYQQHGTVHPKFLVHTDKNADVWRIKFRDLEKKYKQSLEHNTELENALQALTELRNSKVAAASISPKSQTKGSESIAVALLSDVHFEEDVQPEKVLGSNEFNPKIARERLNNFFVNTLKMTKIQRGGTRIDTLVLALLGDLISGYIHDELIESNHLSPIQACVQIQLCIKSGIEFLLKEGKFKKIIVPCCVGNHGRTTAKKQISTSTDNSFETMIYISLSEMFKEDKRVEFKIAKGYQIILTLWDNYKIRFHHGDAIRYGGGVGGITIPVNKKIANWNTRETVDLDCFGHFHQFIDGGNFISNGSLIGYGCYAFEIAAKFEDPKQAFFLIEKDKGKTIVAPILV